MKFWHLKDVLIEKYRMLEFEAEQLADFLGKIIKWEPKDRPSAQEMINHPWLKMQARFETKMARGELKEFKKVHGYYVSPSSSEKSIPKGEESSSEEEERKVVLDIENEERDEGEKEWESDDDDEEGDNSKQ